MTIPQYVNDATSAALVDAFNLGRKAGLEEAIRACDEVYDEALANDDGGPDERDAELGGVGECLARIRALLEPKP